MSILEKLTEGIVERDLQKDSHALVEKWEKTGLLEGIGNETKRNSMACLLENQAKELLRESSSMNAGDVEGSLAYFADDKGGYRLYVCEQCHKYIKAIDLRHADPEVSLPLERVLTLDMDRQGQEKGYQPDYLESLSQF